MKLALAQLYCKWGAVKRNLDRHRGHMATARAQGVDLAVFPEMSAQGMWKDHLVRLAAEPLDGPIVRTMAGWAREYDIAVAFGLAEKTSKKPYNTYVLIDRRGNLVGAYRKNYVTVMELHYFRKDTRRPILELDGVKVALSICADNCHPEILESYARRGARIVLMPHAWDADPLFKGGNTTSWNNMEEMVDAFASDRITRFRTHREMLRRFQERIVRLTREFGFYAAFVNQVGTPHPLIPMVGPSFVADPEGQVIACSRNKREGIVFAELPEFA